MKFPRLTTLSKIKACWLNDDRWMTASLVAKLTPFSESTARRYLNLPRFFHSRVIGNRTDYYPKDEA
jgi:response regulator of citrate/malate metabolism